MKINGKEVLKTLKGAELKTETGNVFTMGEALSNILVADKTGGKMKLYILGTKFAQDDSVELDSSDFSLVKEVVKRSEAYSALVLGQVEMILENTKEETSKKK